MAAKICPCVVALIFQTFLAQLCLGNLLVNGDFEIGDLSGWTWQPTEFAEPQMTTGIVPFNTDAYQITSEAFRVNPGGVQYQSLLLAGGGTLSQDVFLTAGESYEISMDYAAQCMLPLPNGSTGKIDLYVGNTQIGTFGPDTIDGYAVTRGSFTGTFIPQDSGSYRVSIVFLRQYGNAPTPDYPTPRIYNYVDNVSLVPEPTTVFALQAVVAVTAITKRRRDSLSLAR